MKSKIIFTTIILACAILMPALSRAETTVSLGGTVWYVWWKPAWADNKWTSPYIYDVDAGIWKEDAHDFKPASGAMAGPIITVGFLDRWTISSVTVLGSTNFNSRGYGSGYDYILDAQGLTRKEYTRKVLKWDSDTTLGCAVHKYVKLYAGFKAQGYRYDETIKFYDFTDFFTLGDIYYDHTEGTDTVQCYGPGLGIGFTIPLYENLYMLAGLSGIALWCFEDATFDWKKTYGFDSLGPAYTTYVTHRGKFMSYGGTASLSLAYTIEAINTTLALGGRYQVLYNRQNYKRSNPLHSDVTMNMIDRQYDHFAGVTFSAIYTFHIGKKA